MYGLTSKGFSALVIYKSSSTNAPLSAEAVGSLAGSVGNVVREGAARQRGYCSTALSAEREREPGRVTHPINSSLAAFRRR